jgi:cytochrome c7-like protein/class III cytochrome C family protein
MTQVFQPPFVFLIKLAFLALLVLTFIGVAGWRALTSEAHAVNEAVEQPVPFSHKHHVGDVGLDCRYCHADVETQAFAGIPPISTCMTCHSKLFTDQPVLAPVVKSWQSGIPLRWERVHQLPDFVYFDHSIHVAKGVGCESCHGRVDTMALETRTQDLSMKWCLSCHREPEKFLRPREEEFTMGYKAADQAALGMELVRAYGIDRRRMTDCTLCHR